MRYEWDEAKAAANHAKHGVAFEMVKDFEWESALVNEKSATMKKPAGKRKLVRPTPEQNEQINAGIAADPDTRELTAKDFERMRPAADVHPEIVEAYRRSRGKQKAPTKIATSIRLSPDVLAAYKQTGAGWQRRIDEDLQKIVARRKVKQSPRKRGGGQFT